MYENISLSWLYDNTGLSQAESQLVAKDDNLDAADPNQDKTQDNDEQMDKEEKSKINEQEDQVISFLIFLI